MKSFGLALGAVAVGLLAVIAPPRQEAEDKVLISVATGAKTGVYYLVGAEICRAVNQARWTHGVRCVVAQSEGSIANLRALRSGDAAFAIVQSDWLRHAYLGTSLFEAIGADTTLRALSVLYPEPFTVIARRQSGIAALSDLPGKRVNIGPAGSGGRATMTKLMTAMGWSEDDFAQLGDLGGADLTRALCDGDIDAAALVIAHPNRLVEDVLLSCETRLASADALTLERMVTPDQPYFRHVLPDTTYPGLSGAVETIAVAATLATTSRTPPDVGYVVARAMEGAPFRERLDQVAFARLKDADTTTMRFAAPRHAGANRLAREGRASDGESSP